MLRKLLKVAIAATFGLVAMILVSGGANSADEKAADVKTIMQKSFGKGGYKGSITAAAKEAKWDEAKKLASEWVKISGDIGKNKPKLGEAKSWEELCAKFGDSTKAVLKATEDKDAKAVDKSLGGFNCGACHDAHREKKKK